MASPIGVPDAIAVVGYIGFVYVAGKFVQWLRRDLKR
jgi:hypothetical protein